jgi:hypothetical protein
MLDDLTLCSVSFHSSQHLAANYELTRQINGDVRWLIAQNGPAEELPSFTVVPGAVAPTRIAQGNQNIKIASYHHALGLNALLPHIRTRYAAFMDPDFFIVPPLETVLLHMEKNGLAFFGAPYAIDPAKPRRQDFPTAFCMFVDRQRADFSTFDFSPDVARLDIMADTGFQIYTKYAAAPHEVVLPSYPPGGVPYQHSPQKLSDVCEHKFVRASTDTYFWQDKLFAIHLHMKLHINLQTIGRYATKLAAREDLQTVRNILAAGRRQWGISAAAVRPDAA